MHLPCLSPVKRDIAVCVTLSLLKPHSMLIYGKAELKVMTQDDFVSPWSSSLTQGCITTIALPDSHTGLLKANAN